MDDRTKTPLATDQGQNEAQAGGLSPDYSTNGLGDGKHAAVDSTRKAAHFYAALGWPIFPIWPMRNGRCACGVPNCGRPEGQKPPEGKHPIGKLVPLGVKNATTALSQIDAWWDQYPDANIGVATGAASGLLVVDIDPGKGGEVAWGDLVAEYGRPDTVEAISGSGGNHYFFRYEPGLGNTSQSLGPGIDTRGEGGYIILPPSNHKSGNRYEWELSSHPRDVSPEGLPGWLLSRLTQAAATPKEVVFSANGSGAGDAPDLGRLKVTEIIRQTIRQTPDPTSDRSAIDQSVITALVGAGADDDLILAIFEHYPIGAAGKFADQGRHGRSYLAHSIGRARAYLEKQGSGQTPTATAGASAAGASAAGASAAGTSAAGTVAPIRPILMSDLMAKDFPDLYFLVDGLLAKGNLAMLGGRAKGGKSWLVCQLAQAVDMGIPFLGKQTKKGRVLYFPLEDGERRIQQRAQFLGWKPERAAVHFTIANFDGDGVPGPGLLQIEQLAPDYDLIIVDTLIATLSGRAKENDNAQMGEIVNELARIAHTYHVCIVLVHHTGKGLREDVFDLLRGASALRGAYDLGLLLERKQGEREAILHCESRDLAVEPITIQQAENGAGWECIGNAHYIKELRAGRQIVETITEHGEGLTVKELAELSGKSQQTIRDQLLKAEKRGQVEQATDPAKVKGKPAAGWWLTPAAGGKGAPTFAKQPDLLTQPDKDNQNNPTKTTQTTNKDNP